jgi:hypothetical protein
MSDEPKKRRLDRKLFGLTIFPDAYAQQLAPSFLVVIVLGSVFAVIVELALRYAAQSSGPSVIP